MSKKRQKAISGNSVEKTSLYSGVRVQRALRIYYVHKLGNLFLASFFQIFIAKILRPESYATYAILLAIIMASERLLSFGLDRTVMRFVPSLTSHGSFASLRWLFVRMALVRCLSLAAMLVIIFLAAPSIENLLPTPLSVRTVYAFAFWFVCTSLLSDADAIAQSWMAHVDIAVAATLEILVRCVSISLLAIGGYSVDTNLVVLIYAVTNTLALLGLVIRLFAIRDKIRRLSEISGPQKYPAVDVKEAPMFAAAAYASTLGWLTTSPAVVRIVSKGGLDVLAFASFSFIQALCISLQRGFPGLLILPSLEPVMAKLSGTTLRDRMFAIMSFVFKIELVAVLAIVIIMATAGADLITLLSRSAYAPFFYVLPFLLVVLVLQTLYRICEIIMSVNLEHRLFLALWPLSVLSIATLYFTVGHWGLWSILLVPIAEGTLRITIIFVMYRHAKMWRALDPVRSLQLILSATAVILTAVTVRIWSSTYTGSVGIATIGLLIFFGSLFIVRPFRPTEVNNLAAMLPASLNIIKRFAHVMARK